MLFFDADPVSIICVTWSNASEQEEIALPRDEAQMLPVEWKEQEMHTQTLLMWPRTDKLIVEVWWRGTGMAMKAAACFHLNATE